MTTATEAAAPAIEDAKMTRRRWVICVLLFLAVVIN